MGARSKKWISVARPSSAILHLPLVCWSRLAAHRVPEHEESVCHRTVSKERFIRNLTRNRWQKAPRLVPPQRMPIGSIHTHTHWTALETRAHRRQVTSDIERSDSGLCVCVLVATPRSVGQREPLHHQVAGRPTRGLEYTARVETAVTDERNKSLITLKIQPAALPLSRAERKRSIYGSRP